MTLSKKILEEAIITRSGSLDKINSLIEDASSNMIRFVEEKARLEAEIENISSSLRQLEE